MRCIGFVDPDADYDNHFIGFSYFRIIQSSDQYNNILDLLNETNAKYNYGC